MTNIWFLENVNLFDILCPHKFEEYKSKHEFRPVKKNEFVYLEGDSSNKIFLIVQGKVKIGYYTPDGREVLKAVLTRGEIFGEMALLGESKRSEFARSLDSNTLLCPMSMDTLRSLMLSNADFSLKIHKWIGLKIKKIERKLELLVFKDTRTRLIEFIKELQYEYGYKSNNSTIIKHPYTQKDIADLIGASRQTVNSLLNEFYNEGLIVLKRSKIILKKEF